MNLRNAFLILSFLAFFSFFVPCSRGATHAWDQKDSLISNTDRALTADSIQATTDEMVPFRSELLLAARKHQVPAALLAAFCQEESRFDPWAERSEPRYLKNKSVKRSATKWSADHGGLPTATTELTDRAKSMGLMQPMGETAREQGYDSVYLSSLFAPFNSIDQGAILLKKLLVRYGRDTLAAISAYNAGTPREVHGTFENARYVYRVNVAWQHYNKILHYATYNRPKTNLQMAGRARNAARDSSLAQTDTSAKKGGIFAFNGVAGRGSPVMAGYDLGPRYRADDDFPQGPREPDHDTGLFIAGFAVVACLSGLFVAIRRYERRWAGLDRDMLRPNERDFLSRSEISGAREAPGSAISAH